NDAPGLGGVIRHLYRGKCPLPAAITLPEQFIGNNLVVPNCQNAGFLGRKADPWLLTCDPSAPDFQVPALDLSGDIPPLRFDDRRALLQQVNAHLDRVDRKGALGVFDAQTRQALDLLRSPKARK